LTPEQIREYWTDQARRLGPDPAASWSDIRAMELEISEIGRRLEDGERVLDVGCANGFSTMMFAQQRRISIRGVDYIPEMVAEARARLAEPLQQGSSVDFAVGDATNLDEPSSAYDKVVVIRVVINLSTWGRQVQALKEFARVLKVGGTLLLSEATLQGWRRLNLLRQDWGLEPVPMPSFNMYLDEDAVVEVVAPELELVELVNFSSSYFVATRVIKPLLIRALGLDQDPGDPKAEWNRWASQIPAFGDYGTQKLFVLRRT
jgi:ubiquinone/menaquinone biosynthesis C-methylase UbiE